MTTKEVLEIVDGMEVSVEIKTKIYEMLADFEPGAEVDDKVVDEVLKMIDSGFDPNKVVEDEDEFDRIDVNK